MSHFFRFESEQERSLAYIPMLVRMKLDTCGVKLTLAQWNRLPESHRRHLFETPCDIPAEVNAYRELLGRLVAMHAGESLRLMEIPSSLAWNNIGEVSLQIVERAKAQGLKVPTIDQWRKLTPAQRFALLKLTRAGHDSPSYLPALQEFDLA